MNNTWYLNRDFQKAMTMMGERCYNGLGVPKVEFAGIAYQRRYRILDG